MTVSKLSFLFRPWQFWGLLVRRCVECSSVWFWFFFVIILMLWIWGRKASEMKCHSHHIILRVRDVPVLRLKPWSPGFRWCLSGLSTVNVPFPPFHAVPLEGRKHVQPTLNKSGAMLHHFEDEVLDIRYSEYFCRADLSISLVVYLFNHYIIRDSLILILYFEVLSSLSLFLLKWPQL